MQELVGRLTALDPEASETLKVVAYFDALVAAGVGVDGLLRGAAALSGTVAGAERHGRTGRRGPDGGRPADEPAAPRHPERALSHGSVWLERAGVPHANDEMVVERLALAVELAESRRAPESGLEIAIDPARSVADRDAGLARLRVAPAAHVRIVVTAATAPPPSAPSAIVPTPYGMVRAVLDTTGRTAPAGPAGIGTCVRADHAPESWEAALVAYRLTGPDAAVVDASELGVLVLLARAYDPDAPPADVRALARLDRRSRDVLRAVVEADSLRAAAADLGMHHSTLQARREAFVRELGYDPRSAAGRARYVAASLLLRLTV
jgi:hypothetical protein